jgi:TfoX/Sxy family transcriptional regulator of competence genes
MPQDKEYVQDIVDSLHPLNVRSRPMFGSYGLYCDEKFVGIIGGDQLFIKQTGAPADLFRDTELAPPYDGASDYHLVTEDTMRELDWLREAIQATADALPKPKPKTKKKATG